MQPVIDFFLALGPWNWFILALVLLIAEMLLPGTHIMWFGLSAVVMGLLGVTLTRGLGIEWQLVLFGAISLVFIAGARRFLGPQTGSSDLPTLNVRGAQYIGRLVVVEEAITNGRGKVRVGDTLWQAEGPDAPKGARVKVTDTDGTVLRVSAA